MMNDSDKLQNNGNFLERELSLSGEISPTGLKGKAKLRWNSADKGLFGTAGDFIKGGMARYNARKNAKNENIIALIKAQGETELKDMESKQNLAGLTNEEATIFELIQKSKLHEEVKVLKKKVIMLEVAQEELERQPPKDEESETGPAELSEGFLNRIQEKLKAATEEEVRKKWAKVFAAEIRNPGAFSAVVMRIIEEIDDEAAELFQRICDHRIGDVIPICLTGELNFSNLKQMGNAGLIISSDLGVMQSFQEVKDNRGHELWMTGFGRMSFAFSKNIKLTLSMEKNTDPIKWMGTEKPDGIPCYALTSAGVAIASIFEDKQDIVFHSYLEKLSIVLPDIDIREFEVINEKGVMKLIRTWKNGKPIRTEFYGFGSYNFSR